MTWIGIDPGTHTGIAVWDDKTKRFVMMETMLIHDALTEVRTLHATLGQDIFVIFEDARQRTWFGDNSRQKQQGAGSIKRDCSIWDDFLTDRGIPFRAIPPVKGATKLTEKYFKSITKWKGRTSNHARDAAMLVFGR